MEKHSISGLTSKSGLSSRLKEMKDEDKIILEVSVRNMKELIKYDYKEDEPSELTEREKKYNLLLKSFVND